MHDLFDKVGNMKVLVVVLSTLVLGCLGAHNINGVLVDLARNVKVVNGVAANDGEFPFQVSLQYGGRHYCGATVLTSTHVLTAAHCIYGNTITQYTVRAGSNNYNSGGTVHSVVSGEYHEDYKNGAYWNNDVAVVQVSPPLTIGGKVQPVTLAAAGAEPVDKAASVAIGWGSACYGCSGIADLQKVGLRIYSQADCLALYGDGPTSDMVCSGVPEEGKGICSGDSGGALLVDGVQVGITSWTRIPCAEFPAVWTKVSHYRDWISARAGV